MCEIIERVWNLTVLAGFKNPKFPFFTLNFFGSFQKNLSLRP